jgi:hypothetical protein
MKKQFHFLRFTGKKAILLLSLTLILALSIVGSTIAFFITQTNSLTNTFTPAIIQSATQNSIVLNLGSAPSFIRCSVVINWVSNDGHVYAIAPILGTDYSITYNTDGWAQGSDSFWYYTKALLNVPEDTDINADGFDPTPYITTSLILNCTQLKDAPEGYSLKVEVLSSAIQAEPQTVVEQQWNVAVSNGILTPN